MNEWSGSRYEGEYFKGWYHGNGKFYYPNGVIYEGQFYKGQFHGEGVLIYPNGVTINDFFFFVVKNEKMIKINFL